MYICFYFALPVLGSRIRSGFENKVSSALVMSTRTCSLTPLGETRPGFAGLVLGVSSSTQLFGAAQVPAT